MKRLNTNKKDCKMFRNLAATTMFLMMISVGSVVSAHTPSGDKSEDCLYYQMEVLSCIVQQLHKEKKFFYYNQRPIERCEGRLVKSKKPAQCTTHWYKYGDHTQ
jgi:hypothetical protein